MLTFGTLSELPLKEMDGALLAMTLLETLRERDYNVDSVQKAIALGAYLHRDDVRGARAKLPKDSYITHPLRVALRIVRSYHKDTFPEDELIDLVNAAILHDTVEDHWQELLKIAFGPDEVRDDAVQGTEEALIIISGYFNEATATVVGKVTNPPQKTPVKLTKEEKRAIYQESTGNKIRFSDKKVFATKFSDFYDNAGSLHYNMSGDALTHLVLKYLPLVAIFRERLMRQEGNENDFSEIDKLIIGRQLDKVSSRLETMKAAM